MAVFAQRLADAGRVKRGRQAYIYQIRMLLRVAERLVGAPMTIAQLFCAPEILGRALVDDVASSDGNQLSRWSLDQRRSAVRALATFLCADLTALTGRSPHEVVDSALRSVAQRVGTVYRLPGGRPRRRGGVTPLREEIGAVVEASGRAPGFKGLRNRAFLLLLAETGARVNALRTLDGADCVEMPDGALRAFVHEKGKRRKREIELSTPAASALRAYVTAYNRAAIALGWASRIRLGQPGPVWRNSSRSCWPYPDVLACLRHACGGAGVASFTPHALRRAFASDAANTLSRHEVALAGNWQGLGRLDEHYITLRPFELAHRLAHPTSFFPAVPLESIPYAST